VRISAVLVDASNLQGDQRIEGDVCIIGAGPAGLAIAAELVSSGVTTVVIDSGGWGTDEGAQELNRGLIEGDPHQQLDKTRHRQIGGTATLWNTPVPPTAGARFVPLDAIDFRGERGRPVWPITLEEMTPYYQRAQRVADLGRFDYEATSWQLPASPIPADHEIMTSRIYQFGSAERFRRDIPDQLARSSNATLCSSATAVGFDWHGHSIESVRANGPKGNRFTIHARRYVLAAGGVENARMLLVEERLGTIHDRSGWLGRGYMEHPRDYSLRLVSKSRNLFKQLEFFDAHRREGTIACGRVAFREEAILEHNLPNASITFLPTGQAWRPAHWRVERLAWRRFGWSLQWPPGHWWSRVPSWARFFDGFQLLINLEEFPAKDNRLTLDDARDRFGVPRVRLHRCWHSDDAERLSRLKPLIEQSLAGLGMRTASTIPTAPPDPNSHHHLGATRMGTDSTKGVTDSYGQVFTTDNLFVAGGSLFPSGGYANPTLTAIALAIRLADRLKSGS
jgi:choline dehydrogenase-like flavoprotein